jgi:hypothetical protein
MKLMSIRDGGVEAAGGGLLPEAKARLTSDADEQAREKSLHRQAHRAMAGAAIRQLAVGAGRGR